MKLGVATLRKIVEPKRLNPGAVLENSETAPHFFLSAWITMNLGKQMDQAKSVHRNEVSTNMGCSQGEVLLYIQGIQ